MGEWVEFRQMKKFRDGIIQSNTILDLRTFTGGVPWENEKIYLEMYSYSPDFSKMKYYAEAIPQGDNKYRILSRLVGYDYTTAIRVPDITVNPSSEWITLYTGAFYGVNFTYNNGDTFGAEGHRAYANGNLFSEHRGSGLERIAGYQATYFNESQQNGAIVLNQFARSFGGKLTDIVVFTQPAEYKELLVKWTAMEGDF